MKMKKFLVILSSILFTGATVQAKQWRVKQNARVAEFWQNRKAKQGCVKRRTRTAGLLQQVRNAKQLPVEQPADAATLWQLGKRALQATNAFRAKQGLSQLKWSQSVADIAREHSVNMAHERVEFGHSGFDRRVARFPYPAMGAAENVYMANYEGDIAQIAVDSWIRSPGHLKNLIGNYTDCGIGVYKNAQGFWYFTQIFASY